MKIRWLALAFALCFTGCATTALPEDRPALVHGTVADPEWTNWVRDWCRFTQPVRFEELSGSPTCVPHGGELYRAELLYGQVVGAGLLPARVEIAYPGHALGPAHSIEDYFVVLPAPTDFRKATGLAHVVGDIGNYDPKSRCIVDYGFSHLDSRECNDHAYHKRNHGRCVPLGEYMAHYAGGR